MYQPVYIDDNLEQAPEPPPAWSLRGVAFTLNRFTKWLNDYVPFLIYYELPRGRKSVEAQLRTRRTFPEKEWKATEYSLEMVRRILATIAREMYWPNSNFIPDDPISLLMITDYDDFSFSYVAGGIEDEFGIEYPLDVLTNMCRNQQTLQNVVGDIYRRITANMCVRPTDLE